jgi:hypothetical protein
MWVQTLGLDEAMKRIKALLENGHSAEAMVTSIFTLEKLIKRATRRVIRQSGKSVEESKRLVDKPGFDELCKLWAKYDPDGEGPEALISAADWKKALETKQMRNDPVHGRKVFGLKNCKDRSRHILKVLKKLRDEYTDLYGSDPWKRLKDES